jgi:hypothetical protein
MSSGVAWSAHKEMCVSCSFGVPVSVKFTDIGLAGNQPVRLLWPQKDLPTDVSNVYEATVPRHGVALVKIGRPQNRTTPPK